MPQFLSGQPANTEPGPEMVPAFLFQERRFHSDMYIRNPRPARDHLYSYIPVIEVRYAHITENCCYYGIFEWNRVFVRSANESCRMAGFRHSPQRSGSEEASGGIFRQRRSGVDGRGE